jgi:hypothetical protein
MIKKNIFKLLVVFLLCALQFISQSQAQTIYKGLSIDNSAFLFGSYLARKTQCIYKPSDFNSIPNMGEIIKIYYRYGVTGIGNSHDLSPFIIKMGQTTDTMFQGDSTFFTGLTLVRWDSIFTIPAGVQGEWFGIDLQTPFVYDSTKTLVVETQFFDNTATNFGTLGSYNLTQKLVSSDTAAIYQSGIGSATWQDFGFDYLITTGLKTASTAIDIIIYPNPSTDIITLTNLPLIEKATITMYDVFGHQLTSTFHYANNNVTTLDISNLNQGIYYIQIATTKQTIIKKFTKI